MIILYKNFYAMYEKKSKTVYIADMNQKIIQVFNAYNRKITYDNLRHYIDIALENCGIKNYKCNEYYIITPASPSLPYGQLGEDSYVMDFNVTKWDCETLLN